MTRCFVALALTLALVAPTSAQAAPSAAAQVEEIYAEALEASGGISAIKAEIDQKVMEGKTPYLVLTIVIDPSTKVDDRNVLEAFLQRRGQKDFLMTTVVTKVKEVKRADPSRATATFLVDWVGRRKK